MAWSKAEDAGGLTSAKDGNDVPIPFSPPNVCHLLRQLL